MTAAQSTFLQDVQPAHLVQHSSYHTMIAVQAHVAGAVTHCSANVLQALPYVAACASGSLHDTPYTLYWVVVGLPVLQAYLQ